MAKDPAVLFYTSDFLTGVADLTMEERGQYITILCLQHQKGHLSEKTIRLTVGSISVDVMSKLRQDENGLFFSERMDQEIENRIKFLESRRNNGKLGGRPKSEKPLGKPLGYPLAKANEKLIEDENEDDNEDIELRTKKPKQKIPPLDVFLDYCKTIDGINFSDLQFSLKAKYEAWFENGWRDGNDQKITNWKTKIKNTIPFLKPIYGTDKLGTSAARIQAAADF